MFVQHFLKPLTQWQKLCCGIFETHQKELIKVYRALSTTITRRYVSFVATPTLPHMTHHFSIVLPTRSEKVDGSFPAAQINLIGCKLGQYGGVLIMQELLHLALQHFLFGTMKVVDKCHL
jgi:hypothetical protein